ncbi:MAG: hypothetical protein M0R17_03360 [Candidatus Omnitrophica bacterium]|jgi:hypothetical protein|nr:hypothetical protein [Candidatus Omnitrophota bacterium]
MTIILYKDDIRIGCNKKPKELTIFDFPVLEMLRPSVKYCAIFKYNNETIVLKP